MAARRSATHPLHEPDVVHLASLRQPTTKRSWWRNRSSRRRGRSHTKGQVRSQGLGSDASVEARSGGIPGPVLVIRYGRWPKKASDAAQEKD